MCIASRRDSVMHEFSQSIGQSEKFMNCGRRTISSVLDVKLFINVQSWELWINCL